MYICLWIVLFYWDANTNKMLTSTSKHKHIYIISTDLVHIFYQSHSVSINIVLSYLPLFMVDQTKPLSQLILWIWSLLIFLTRKHMYKLDNLMIFDIEIGVYGVYVWPFSKYLIITKSIMIRPFVIEFDWWYRIFKLAPNSSIC